MKKFFTFAVASLLATNMMAQMPGSMTFVGASNMSVMTSNTENVSDTVKFVLNGMTSSNITLPAMKGMGTIPSFTISDVSLSMGANRVVTIPEQDFTVNLTVNGEEKTVTGESLSGSYNMADNSLELDVKFKYGAMPFSMNYTIKSYYVKAVSNSINVVVGGAFSYDNESVTYNVRKYMDGDVEKVDVEVPAYTLDNTLMGNLTLGTYTVKGLVYDEEKGGFYRDYKDDGLMFHFTAEQGGQKTMDADYEFNKEKDNNILVKYDGTQVSSIVNTFQMGAMPFGIVSTFGGATTGIETVKAITKVANDGKMYNLRGERVDDSFKGVVIVNGKKYLKK